MTHPTQRPACRDCIFCLDPHAVHPAERGCGRSGRGIQEERAASLLSQILFGSCGPTGSKYVPIRALR